MKYLFSLFLLSFLYCSSAETTQSQDQKASETGSDKSLINTIKEKAESDENRLEVHITAEAAGQIQIRQSGV